MSIDIQYLFEQYIFLENITKFICLILWLIFFILRMLYKIIKIIINIVEYFFLLYNNKKNI